jgi:hypothetical protein
LDEHPISAEKTAKRKEVITMVYRKPELVWLGPAVNTIQNQLKGAEVVDIPEEQSAGAYEADE